MANCPTLRRKRLTFTSLNIMTGVLADDERTEWRTESCGTPLFTNDGPVCRSCAKGWKMLGSYPVGDPPAERHSDDPFGAEG